MTKNERVNWVDAAKGVGIFLVVFGHVWRGLNSSNILSNETVYASIDNAIYLFHMPLFFILSGMFFEKTILRDGFVRALLRRIETLLYPLILWSYISALFLFIAGSLTNRGGLTLAEVVLYPLPPKDVYWFLAALFIIQLIASVFVESRVRAIYWVGLAASSFLILLIDPSSWPVWIRNTIENAPLFFVGMLMSGWTPKGSQGFIGLLIFLAAETWAVTRSNSLSAPTDFLPGVAATIGFIAFCSIALRGQSLFVTGASILGRASMTIYVSHVIALAAMRIALLKVGIDNTLVHLLCGVGAGLVLPLILHKLLAKLHLLRAFGLGKDSPQSKKLQPAE